MSKDKKPSTFLDVDPSIIEDKIKIVNSNLEEEFKNLLNPPQQEKSFSLKPIPGFCLKTHDKNTEQKIFINICHASDMPGPVDINEEELTRILNSDEPSHYRVPMSIGDCHMEKDNSGKLVTVYDILINSNFLKKIMSSPIFKLFFISLIFEGLADKYQLELDVGDHVILKNKKSMGPLHRHVVKDRDLHVCEIKPPLIQEIPNAPQPTPRPHPTKKETKRNPRHNAPREMDYHIIREPPRGRVKYLIGEFKVDKAVTGENITLDIGEDRIIVEILSTNQVVDVFVPYLIKADTAKAVLNHNTSVLTVTMNATDPIIPIGELGLIKV